MTQALALTVTLTLAVTQALTLTVTLTSYLPPVMTKHLIDLPPLTSTVVAFKLVKAGLHHMWT